MSFSSLCFGTVILGCVCRLEPSQVQVNLAAGGVSADGEAALESTVIVSASTTADSSDPLQPFSCCLLSPAHTKTSERESRDGAGQAEGLSRLHHPRAGLLQRDLGQDT